MKSVTIPFEEDVLTRIDAHVASRHWTSRTEFIREAVRDKLEALRLSRLDREQLIKEFMKLRGSSGKTTTEEEEQRIEDEVSKEMLEEHRRSKVPLRASK